jgi:hypothetical protein
LGHDLDPGILAECSRYFLAHEEDGVGYDDACRAALRVMSQPPCEVHDPAFRRILWLPSGSGSVHDLQDVTIDVDDALTGEQLKGGRGVR